MNKRISIRKIIYLILLIGFGVSCVSSQKLLQRGEYDKAIERSAEKLQKKPGNSKELGVLKEAFYLANTFDLERIEFLKLEGLEDSWIEIYQIYELLDWRQTVVRRLPSRVRSQFEFVNYAEHIIEARSEAASVSYERGVELLERGDRHSARQAYGEFNRVRQIYPAFLDVDHLVHESLNLGTNNVLFGIENNSDMILPSQFEAEMQRIALKDLNTSWINFDTYENSDLFYDYYVALNIKNISVSPERVEVNRFSESRDIEDGERFKLDENGNVMKDSLGNDIKVPNLVTVTAEVVESVQKKSAFVSGSLDFYDLRTDQLVRTDNISIESVFAHHSAVAIGNSKALSEETQKKVGQRPVSFPSNEALLIDSVDLLKDRSKRVLAANRRMLEQ